ncbi:MAG: hypothetical protein KGD63_07360 [Candidatus Lokiarchaeota archaeon]|nr:hypothetical protein [Candidatus Lokiarchaeota archaeon]
MIKAITRELNKKIKISKFPDPIKKLIYLNPIYKTYLIRKGLLCKIPGCELAIFMSKEQIKTIKKYLKEEDIMLEWGSGGSTAYFSQLVKKYISIEHNKEWYSIVKKYISKKVELHYIKSNMTPSQLTKRCEFVDYIEKVNKLNVNKFNKVLIDGRARTYCAIEILPYLDEKSIVFIHDFHVRPRYKSILKYYDLIEEIKANKGLVVLKPKKTFLS